MNPIDSVYCSARLWRSLKRSDLKLQPKAPQARFHNLKLGPPSSWGSSKYSESSGALRTGAVTFSTMDLINGPCMGGQACETASVSAMLT